MKQIRVVELFAGVGGFRLGLEGWKKKSASSGYKKRLRSKYKVVWSNQWEPPGSLIRQFASHVYIKNWGDKNHSNEDIGLILKNKFDLIPEHDLLVAGFPCQDYSIATNLNRSGGIKGKKGVLWWNIYELLNRIESKPKYVLLENVDRLIKSPVDQRGRDFAIMLGCLDRLGYAVEWRVVNAADYGMPQRRRRVFILGYLKGTSLFDKMTSPKDWIYEDGVLAKAFPVAPRNDELLMFGEKLSEEYSAKDKEYIRSISENFNQKVDKSESNVNYDSVRTNRAPSLFENTGIMKDGIFYTIKTTSKKEQQDKLKHYLIKDFDHQKHKEFIVEDRMIYKESNGWEYHKGPKSKDRKVEGSNYKYKWAEGRMDTFDDIEKPARTIITSEGGQYPSRTKHLIQYNGINRRLLPIEIERLNMFPDNFTKFGLNDDGEQYDVDNVKRAFLMGNALVVGVIEKIGHILAKTRGN